MVAAFWVGLGGMIGALLRYGVGLALQSWHAGPFPAATLAVNAVGCLALGYLLGSQASNPGVSDGLYLFLGVGLLGAFTTFSAFGAETVGLVQDGNLSLALASVGLNLGLGFAAVLVGAFLGA